MPRIPRTISQQTIPALAPARLRSARTAGVAAAALRGFTDSVQKFALGLVEENQREKAAGRAVEETRITSDVRLEATAMRLQAERDAAPGAPDFADSLDREFKDLTRARLETVDPKSREQLTKTFDLIRTDLGVRALTFENQSLIRKRHADFRAVLDTGMNTVRSDDAEFAVARMETFDAIAGAFPANQQAKLQRLADGDLARSLLAGLNKRDPVRAEILLEDGVFDSVLDPADKDALVKNNQVELRRVGREAAATQRLARDRISDVLRLLKAGELPTADSLRAAQMIAQTHPELANDLARAQELAVFTRGLLQSPPAEIQGEINRLRALPTKTVADLDRIEAADNILRTQKTGLATDPLSFGVRAGVVTIEPIDQNDPATFHARVVAAETVSQTYGVPAVPLTDEELADVVQRYNSAPATGKLAVLQGVAAFDMPQAMLDQTLRAVSGKNAAIGLVADLSSRDLITARRVVIGQEFIANNPDTRPSNADTETVIEEMLGNALISDQTGKTRAAVIDAADAVYIAGRSGKSLSIFESDEYQAALTAVLGGVAERNGQKFILPFGMTEDGFEKVFESLTDDQLHPQGFGQPDDEIPTGPHRLTPEGLVPVSAEEIIDDGRLVSVAPGQYYVGFVIGGGLFGEGRIEFAIDGAGRPFVLDLITPPAPAVVPATPARKRPTGRLRLPPPVLR